MTVKQLIERLQQLPDQDAMVAMQPYETQEAVAVKYVEGYPKDHNFPYCFLVGERD